jgi:hypothetical protein
MIHDVKQVICALRRATSVVNILASINTFSKAGYNVSTIPQWNT